MTVNSFIHRTLTKTQIRVSYVSLTHYYLDSLYYSHFNSTVVQDIFNVGGIYKLLIFMAYFYVIREKLFLVPSAVYRSIVTCSKKKTKLTNLEGIYDIR